MGISEAISYIAEPFTNARLFGLDWVMQIVIIIVTLVIITRHTEEWGTLLLPVIIGWRTAGLDVNYILFIISIFTFVIGCLSIKSIGEAMGSFKALGERTEYIKGKAIGYSAGIDRWKRLGYRGAKKQEKLDAFLANQAKLLKKEKESYGKLGYHGFLQMLKGEKPTETAESARRKDYLKFQADLDAKDILRQTKGKRIKEMIGKAMQLPTTAELEGITPEKIKRLTSVQDLRRNSVIALKDKLIGRGTDSTENRVNYGKTYVRQEKGLNSKKYWKQHQERLQRKRLRQRYTGNLQRYYEDEK